MKSPKNAKNTYKPPSKNAKTKHKNAQNTQKYPQNTRKQPINPSKTPYKTDLVNPGEGNLEVLELILGQILARRGPHVAGGRNKGGFGGGFSAKMVFLRPKTVFLRVFGCENGVFGCENVVF
jgi:hypothetical protein